MDLVNFCKAVQENFLPAAINLFLMFFGNAGRQTDSWFVVHPLSSIPEPAYAYQLSIALQVFSFLWPH